ncbi:MAG: hypothetical protein QXG74_06160 [Acidilobaceae archaeon]
MSCSEVTSMMDFDTAKLLGVIGSIMVIVGYILPIFAVVGLILIGLSLRYLSNTFKDAFILGMLHTS